MSLNLDGEWLLFLYGHPGNGSRLPTQEFRMPVSGTQSITEGSTPARIIAEAAQPGMTAGNVRTVILVSTS